MKHDDTHGVAVGRRPPRRILIVEDNPAVTRALGGILRLSGFETLVFHAAEPALQHVAAHGPPDAALVDIHLPGLSGLDLTQKLRAAMGEEVPVIIVSGDTSMETLRSLPQAGATYFFPKPVNAQNLIDRLRELVG